MTIMIALLIAASPAAEADPIASAASGLVAVIEEDGHPDAPLRRISTRACRTTLSGGGRQWTIEWRRPARITLEDTFVFVDAPSARLAIVADASRRDQAERLSALARALQETARRCWPR